MINRIAKVSLWLLGGAVLLQLVMPFVYPISGHDSFTHLNWLEQFSKLFREGNVYPRWMPESFWGFGSPAFYFYPPLTYWCAGLLSFILPTPVAIYQTLGLLGTIASVVTCYWYLRSITNNERSAWAGALVYGVFPYRLLDLYLRNALSEHLAFIFLPLIFLGIERALQCSTKKNIFITIVISAIGWAGILLSNIPASVIAMYVAPIYSIIRARESKLYKSLLSTLSGALIGLMIAAFYLIPINHFTSAIKVFHFWDFLDDESKTGIFVDFIHGRNRFFYVGLIMTFVLGLGLFIKTYRLRKITVHTNMHAVILSFLLIAVVIQIPYLFFSLLNIAPFFRLIQFSFRWDILFVFASAIFAAMYYRSIQQRAVKIMISIIAVVTLTIAIGYFLSMQSEHWQYNGLPEHIDVAEYLPLSANNDFEIEKNELRHHAADDLILSANEPSRFHILSVTSQSIRFSVDSSKLISTVIFHRMFFPTWKLRHTSGQEIPLTSDSLGRINAILPAVQGEYRLAIEESEIEKTGEIISVIGLSLLTIFTLVTIFWQNPKVS